MLFRIGTAITLAIIKLILDTTGASAGPHLASAGFPIDGIIGLVCGIYAVMLATGYYPGGHTDTKLIAWKKQWGTPLLVAGPILIVLGTLQIAGVY